jgi:uncharacterized membrane protein YqhA
VLRKIELAFENALWSSRLVMVLAVVASVVSAIVMTLLGVFAVWEAVVAMGKYLSAAMPFAKLQKHTVAHVIGAVDAFLIATVLLILAFGIYELFVSQIDPAERDARASKLLIMKDLSQLKAKLASVIVMVLVVTFLKEAMTIEIRDIMGLLGFAGGILLCAGALCLMHRIGAVHEPRRARRSDD